METLRLVVLLVHLIGFAVLFGAWAVEAFGGSRKFTRLQSLGMTIAAVAGLVLAAPWGDREFDYTKIAVKLVVLLVIGAILGIGTARQKRGASIAPALFWSVGALTLVNAGIAVLWR